MKYFLLASIVYVLLIFVLGNSGYAVGAALAIAMIFLLAWGWWLWLAVFVTILVGRFYLAKKKRQAIRAAN